jgi:thiol-disulfide isomerase/thioredoxin
MRLVASILLATMVCPTCFGQAIGAGQVSTYLPVTKFDAKRDAAADISAATTEAQRTGRRIILYVGGPWCPYCDQLETLFQKNSELRQFRDTHFITVPIYIGSDKNNAPALASYTPILGIPHFFVLESDGTLLHSQHVVDLREDGDYSPSKLTAFFTQWARPEPVAINNAR